MIIIFLDEDVKSITQYKILNWIFELGNNWFPRIALEPYMHEGQIYLLPKMMTIDYYSRLDDDIRYLVNTICPFKEMIFL